MKNSKIKYFIYAIIAIFVGLLIEKYYFSNQAFMIDRFFFVIAIIFFCLFYIFSKEKSKINNYLYIKRYPIGILLFLLLVIFGYHGSSINIYNQVIDYNEYLADAKVFGKDRLIRGDEWIINSTSMVSQLHNNYEKNGDILTATERNLMIFPKVATKSISILGNLNYIGFLFLPINQAYSFYWYIGYFALFFGTFELIMILTKKRNVAFFGAIMITFASSVQWWEAWNIIAYGELALVFFHYFLQSNNYKKKIIYSLLIGIMGASYVFCLYPAWMIPYAYFFLIILIWLILSNKDKVKIKDLLMMVLIAVAVMACILVPTFIEGKKVLYYTTNTVYPGKRLSLGGDSWTALFKYFTNIFTPYVDVTNPCEMSQFLSLYPMPVIIGLVQIIKNIKNKKKDYLLTSLTILVILLSVWNYIKLPKIVSKLTLLSMSTTNRSTVVVSYICIFIMIIWINNYAKEKKNNILLALGALIYSILGVLVAKQSYSDYMNNIFIAIDIILFSYLAYLLLLNNKKYNNLLLASLAICVFISGAIVHPINKNVDVFSEKSFAKAITNLNSEDKIWATISTPYYLQNYLTAVGARTLNSTNYYPNFKLWDILDKEGKYNDIYNRYAHMTINLSNSETSVEKMYEDHIILNITNKDICRVGINYLVTEGIDLTNQSDKYTKYEKAYVKNNLYIFSVSCK